MRFQFSLPGKPASLLLVAGFICIIFVNPGCGGGGGIEYSAGKTIKPWRSYIQINYTESLDHADSLHQLILWAPPHGSDDQINNFLAGLGDVKISRFCASCDSGLMLLTGPGVNTLIQSGTASGGNGSGGVGKPVGGDGGLYWMPNFPLAAPEAKDTPVIQQPLADLNRIPILPRPGLHKGTVTVGVFDTGIDTTRARGMGPYLVDGRTLPSSCLGPLAGGGWNFAYNSANWTDDYVHGTPDAVGGTRVDPDSKHGTSVARFILDQALQYGLGDVKILPVKIHNSKGEGSLFSALCGFAYAKDRGAQIINASFGFYATRDVIRPGLLDSNVLLLKEYVRHYLTDNHILLVAAAGNRDSQHQQRLYRDLDRVSFYPASLARDLENVIVVTTLIPPVIQSGKPQHLPDDVSSNQNFSAQVVSVGVLADRERTGDPSIGRFDHPVLARADITGSSFATPIVTGKIAAYYFKIAALPADQRGDRQHVFSILQDAKVLRQMPAIAGKVTNGNYMTKR